MKGVIYLATNKIDSKVYVGKTVQTLRERRKGHENESLKNRTNTHFHNALRKYGFDFFKWKIIDWAKTEKELNLLEELYIEEYRRKGHTYNMTNGGDGASGNKHTEEAKRKIGKASKGNKNNLGKKFSDETKRKMSKAKKGNKYGLGYKASVETRKKLSEANKGEKHPFYGKHHINESKRRISEANKGQIPWNRGKHPTEESKRKMSESHKGKKHTEETLMKMSEAAKGNQNSLGYKHSKEAKKNMSEAQRIRRENVGAGGVLSFDISTNKENSGRYNNAMAS